MNPLESAGWRDMFRALNPRVDAPTWYSRNRNGFRLDQAFVNAELHAYVTSCDYDWGGAGEGDKLSDHAAILLDIDSAE